MTKVDMGPSPEGFIFSVSGSRYIAPRGSGAVPKDVTLPKAQDFSLVTVFATGTADGRVITAKWLKERIEIYKKADDVFQEAFLSSVIFQGPNDVEVTTDAAEFLSQLGNDRMVTISSPDLLPGPYALIKQELREVWRLVDDFNGTCMATLKPSPGPSDTFETFALSSSDRQFLSFAIPSRIRGQAVNTSPLAGLRIVIKDNIDLKGIKTSVGNRAFYDTYPARSESAECVQRLINRGVVILGKTKMNSFGNWEEPTEYIDYQAPWNPRADKYQSPGGSSSGSAAAIASYDWLDIAIGTDTWGSVTRPAHWCGCFGLRPSIGAVAAKGVEPYVVSWDIPGILGRDLQKCRAFASEWLIGDALDLKPKPFSSIIWPTDFWSIIQSEQKDMARGFAKEMASHLEVPLEDVSFEAAWGKSQPPEARGLSLSEFICPATAALAYDVYHNSSDFRARYWKLYEKAPYTTRPNQRLWSVGKTISKEDRDAGFKNIDIYSDWFRDIVLSGIHYNALTILPLETTAPRYRDEIPKFKRPPQDGINALALAPVLKAPVLTVPIAEIPYHSRVTDREEKLPFTVAIMGNPGTDLSLIDMAHEVLKNLGLPTILKTGSSMYE